MTAAQAPLNRPDSATPPPAFLKKSKSSRPLLWPATRGDLTVTVTATGTLAPTNQVDVGIEVSGTVKEVLVDFNDKVTIGEPLARIDPTKLEAQLRQTTAALAAAKAKVLQIQSTVLESKNQLARLEQVHKMSGGKVPSQLELDGARANAARARADLVSAQASVEQTQAVLNANRSDLSKTVVRSPINGIVLNRNVEPGQTIAATFQAPVLFTLAENLAQMELQVDVDEADVGQVHAGQTAHFTVDAYPDREFDAKVTQVRFGSQTVSGVVTYKTILTVDNQDLLLRPGMTATAQIIVSQDKNVLLVPNAALRFTPEPQTAAKSNAGFIASMIPRPPSAKKIAVPTPGTGQHVWILHAGQPVAIAVTALRTDGLKTAIAGDAIEPGTPLIIDRAEPAK
ncbi:MAG: efflux transporter periplasmic adaptor subunit [Halothiobacillus sp. 28-55-5]|nr:MAG: efflux transporter periplasmic adaptor subunit [Halothiobacillus sp. 28-55-5]